MVFGLLEKITDRTAEVLTHSLADPTKLAQYSNEAALAAMDVVKQQLAHPSIFVAGARPFLQWAATFSVLIVMSALLAHAVVYPDDPVPAALALAVDQVDALATLAFGTMAWRGIEKMVGKRPPRSNLGPELRE